MSVSVNGQEVKAAVFDFDETLYQFQPEKQALIWLDLRRQLVISALAGRGITNPSEEMIEKTVAIYIKQAEKLGWKHSYLALGGNEEDYPKITGSFSIAEYLSYDSALVELLNLLSKYFPVHIFTGSSRECAFDALEVLIGELSDRFTTERMLTSDDMRRGTKPDLEAYQEMLERFALEPKSTIFVDDQLSEVETAASLGMITFLLQQASQGETQLGPHIVLKSLYDLLEHLKIED